MRSSRDAALEHLVYSSDQNLDKQKCVNYNIVNIANIADGALMGTKLIASTEAQNNFGRILDDVVQNSTRYVIQRRNTSQAILLSMADLESILMATEADRRNLGKVIRELSPTYSFGSSVKE